MNIDEFAKAQNAWRAKGNPPCDHPRGLFKESSISGYTGDYGCPVCGETRMKASWPPEAWQEKEQ